MDGRRGQGTVGDEGSGVSKRLHGEAGANAVEFALVLPLLLMLVFGVIYFGFAFNTQLTLTQAAREGARLGATFPLNATNPDATTPNDAWFEAVVARIDDAAFGDRGLGNGPRQVCVRFVGPDGASAWWTEGGIAAADCQVDVSPAVAAEPHVQVLVRRQVPIELVVVPLDGVTVGATAVARYEGVLPEAAS
jgi:hypothetical protein